MQVWDGLSSARITFDAYDTPDAFATEAGPSMARFVENLHLQRALIESLEARGEVELIGGQKVANVVREPGHGWPIVELEGGRRIRARLLVGRLSLVYCLNAAD